MIYLTFSECVAERYKLHSLMSAQSIHMTGSVRIKFAADTIFCFAGDKTSYYKDRYGTDYQYVEDERIMIALRAQPFS